MNLIGIIATLVALIVVAWLIYLLITQQEFINTKTFWITVIVILILLLLIFV